MSNIDKHAVQAVADLKAGYTLGHADVAILNELARIALASLEAEPVAFRSKLQPPNAIGSERWDYTDHRQPDAFELESCVIERLYTAPPAPVSVPDGYRLQPISEYDAMCAAMLQGADRPQNETQNIPENIPATQFKPVADLYGLTSPTGSETSFTFDAVEARDFIGGGWSCQEYVELERFQEAVSGNSPVIPDGWQLVPKKITLEMECALSRADSYEIGWRWALAAAPTHSGTNDGWVACSERMPGMGVDVLACTISPIGGFEEIETAQWHGGMKGEQPVFITSADAIEPTHWMPLPAAPKQELK
ncbi:DUF551 domain-containing protein [Enterobacter roggenkampii]